MKKLFLLTVLTASALLHAQADFQGVAVYTSMTSFKNMNFTIEGDPAAEASIKESLAKGMEKEYTLIFNKIESVYEEEEKLLPQGVSGGISFNFRDGKLYTSLKDKITVKESDMFNKEFLVTDSLRHRKWILGEETKKIGNYTCYKATDTIKIEPPTQETQDKAKEKGVDLLSIITPKTIVITAWYTPEIPVSHGPGNYDGLPGLVLEVSDDNTTLLCTKVTLNPKEKSDIKPPTKGEKVTKEKFLEIIDKKLNEMRDMHTPASGGRSTGRFVPGG